MTVKRLNMVFSDVLLILTLKVHKHKFINQKKIIKSIIFQEMCVYKFISAVAYLLILNRQLNVNSGHLAAMLISR